MIVITYKFLNKAGKVSCEKFPVYYLTNRVSMKNIQKTGSFLSCYLDKEDVTGSPHSFECVSVKFNNRIVFWWIKFCWFLKKKFPDFYSFLCLSGFGNLFRVE